MCNVSFWRRAGAILLVAVCTLIVPSLAKADNPIRVGLSVALTGGVAAAGKQSASGAANLARRCQREGRPVGTSS
jgi:hypothetical protein